VKGTDVYALTSAEVSALAVYLSRACVAGVRPVGATSLRVVDALLSEGARLAVVDGKVKP
jgi:hypothetical protein